jgi:hypothetical protein
VVRTIATRKNRNEELVRLAAEWWSKWNPQKHSKTQPQWVAGKMQESLPEWRQDQGLKGNWVTRHRAEIEAEVVRRRHAKG